MTRRQITTNPDQHHWKVRVCIPGSVIHLASWNHPEVIDTGTTRTVIAEWIDDPDLGDSIGWIDWDHVAAVTWRYSGSGR